jgi:ABC-type transport system substrate-binding protein
LLYLHTFGSALRNIPARPVIEPALAQQDVRNEITIALGEAARAVLKNDTAKAKRALEKAGRAGRDAAKSWFFEENGWQPLSPSTIARKGSDQPLIETQRMFNAIGYTVVMPGLDKVDIKPVAESIRKGGRLAEEVEE